MIDAVDEWIRQVVQILSYNTQPMSLEEIQGYHLHLALQKLVVDHAVQVDYCNGKFYYHLSNRKF